MTAGALASQFNIAKIGSTLMTHRATTHPMFEATKPLVMKALICVSAPQLGQAREANSKTRFIKVAHCEEGLLIGPERGHARSSCVGAKTVASGRELALLETAISLVKTPAFML